ncbi:MAG: phage exclusion protein Lit family protein [Alphaproteobacteria bacterium]
MRWIIVLLVAAFVGATPARAVMLERGDLYTKAELEKDAVRLRVAVIKIYEKGIRPVLTSDEINVIGGEIGWDFPLPGDNNVLMNFYSLPQRGRIVLPILSLKALEDTTTAYAWLLYNKKNLDSIDLYYSMLRYRDREDFPGGRYPSILKALGIPDNALKDKRVDELSLSLRNEAFAFIIAHEFGHIHFQHPAIDGLTVEKVRAGEIEADNFAYNVLGRSQTPVVGAVLFFQAQLYSFTHRAEFPTREKWENYMRKVMTHPLGVYRISAMVDYFEGPLARSRSGETMKWREFGAMVRRVLPLMEDIELSKCVIKIAKNADISILRQHSPMSRASYMEICRGL